MDWKSGSAGLIVAVLLGACTTTPSELPIASAPIPQIHRASAQPEGFISFCIRFPDQCAATPGGKDTVTLDKPTWLLLNAVNTTVNGSIWHQDDLKHYGRAEYWNIPSDGYGDCEDYALTKRKNLLQAGFPTQALRLAVVNSPATGRHAVLTVVTDKGDYVLDNLTGEIQSWRTTGYTWIERQDSTSPTMWVSLFPAYAEQRGEQPTAAGNTTSNLGSIQQANGDAPTASARTANNDNSSSQSSTVGTPHATTQ